MFAAHGLKRVRARYPVMSIPSRTMGCTDAGAASDHDFDLALKSRRAQRALLLDVRTNLSEPIITQGIFEKMPVGNAAF